ncbi:hypothetical protein [Nocardia sp. NPDC020380]|uniref:hypothetical protein n=1 Tax=Nocardia sp. NPDC020380 TaxID=3364309 RepID=UPI003795386B
MSGNSGIRVGVARGVQLHRSQLEPEPGRYDWSAVDAVLEQTDADTELWFTITTTSAPPGPAGYAAMVCALVAHCDGRVRYWQCENEPSNGSFGAAEDYVRHLIGFHAAVRAGDPLAEVVLGACPPRIFANPDEPDPERDFFLHVIRTCGAHYDLFDLHLYGDPYLVPVMVENARAALRAAGDEKPFIAGEYNHLLDADDIVMRNILALSCGIDRTLCWQLPVRSPCTSAFTELAFRLEGAKAVERITVPERPDAYIYDIAGTEWQVGWLRREHSVAEPESLVWNNIKVGSQPIYLRANR